MPEREKKSDDFYKTDRELVLTACGDLLANPIGSSSFAEYWVASRLHLSWSPSAWMFGSYKVVTGTSMSYTSIYSINSNIGKENTTMLHIRPIVILKNDIITTGSGTQSDPYVLP